MESGFDVVVVSAFGRGNWLAAELARQSYRVALVDNSSQLGRWAPEDWEGPFGFFRTDRLRATQIERLLEDDFPETVPQGFTLWPSQGPVEFKGALTSHRLQALRTPPEVIEYLQSYFSLPSSKKELLNYRLRQMPFAQNWLAQLAHQLASSVFSHNAQSLDVHSPLPLFGSYMVRQATRPGAERSLAWCEYSGVRVYRQSQLVDVSLEGKHSLVGVEIKSDQSGLLKGAHFVWGLSSAETAYLLGNRAEALFPSGPLEEDWSWLRYRVKIGASERRAALPLHWVMIEELDLPWTHDNLCVARGTFSPEDFDLWVRIPVEKRFQQPYLQGLGQTLVERLRARLPETPVDLQELPQEALYSFSELGPSRFPVFNKKKRDALARASLRNLWYDGPEKWTHLSWDGALAHHATIEKKIRETFIALSPQSEADL